MRAPQRLLGAGKNRNARSAEFHGVERVARGLLYFDISGHGRNRNHPHFGSAQRHDEGDGIVRGYIGIDEEGARHPRSIANRCSVSDVRSNQ